MFLGLFFCRIVRRYSPKYQPPRVENTMPQSRSDASNDITTLPPSSQNDDFFRKSE